MTRHISQATRALRLAIMFHSSMDLIDGPNPPSAESSESSMHRLRKLLIFLGAATLALILTQHDAACGRKHRTFIKWMGGITCSLLKVARHIITL